MANEMTGYSFQPGQDNGMRKTMNAGTQQSGNNMANQALRVLSLRLPNILGGRPLSPRSLMEPTMGGNGLGSGNQSLTVTGPNATSSSGLGAVIGGAMSGSGGGPGRPNITPGGIREIPPPVGDILNNGGGEGGNSGGGYSFFPSQPGGWTGPITGGITGSTSGSVDNNMTMPTLDLNILPGLLRLFGGRG